jgi:hypothetical protein
MSKVAQNTSDLRQVITAREHDLMRRSDVAQLNLVPKLMAGSALLVAAVFTLIWVWSASGFDRVTGILGAGAVVFVIWLARRMYGWWRNVDIFCDP